MGIQSATPSDYTEGFDFYRSTYENGERQQSIETEGYFDIEDFKVATQAPTSTLIEVDFQGQPLMLPLLEDISHGNNWFNLEYYRRIAQGAPLVRYSHLASVYRQDPTSYLNALRPGLVDIARAGGRLLLDHPDREMERVSKELNEIADLTGLKIKDEISLDDSTAKHYHYASPAVVPGQDESVEATLTMQERLDGAVVQSEGTSAQLVLDPKDADEIWGFYKPVFDGLTRDDPVNAGFNVSELNEVAQSTDYIKFIHRSGGVIVNMCLVADVRNCPWMNQYYFRTQFPEAYKTGSVLVCPGIIANPKVAQRRSSFATLGLVGKTIISTGAKPVFTFACDSISNQNVPVISQRVFKDQGIELDLAKPVGHQNYRLLSFHK